MKISPGAIPACALLFLAVLASGACGSDGEGDAVQQASQSPTATRAVVTTPQPTPAPTLAPTPPPTDAPRVSIDPILVGAGDIASCTQENDTETAALLDAVIAGSAGEVVIFTAGDNVYDYGTAEEFAQCYDPAWGRHKARTRPAPGNHDYASAGAAGYYDYFGANAGEPGVGYYSYDLGAWHVIVLNTGDHCRSILCSAGSPQETWLRADLAAHPNACTVAIWHDPRFSSGKVHGSKGYVEPLWNTLYEYGADLVLNGHEHNYERFAPQKPSGEADPTYGIREIIAGTGGESHYREGPLLPNSEAANGETYGVLKLTLRPAGYDWEFIPVRAGQFTDSGSAECHGPPPR